MRKSLPLIVGAVVVPLFAATVAAFAATEDGGQAPAQSTTTSTSVTSPSATPQPIAGQAVEITPSSGTPQRTIDAGVLQEADPTEPVTPMTTTTTRPPLPGPEVPPNQWATPEPTVPPLASPIPTGITEMTVSWDGLKCATTDSWSVPTYSGVKLMCPGSATP